MKGLSRAAVIFLAAALITGCRRGTVREAAEIRSPEAVATVPPSRHRIDNVPFFPDNTDQCGPSALASVLTFYGVPTDPAALKRDIYLPNLKGTLPMDMLPAVEARGLRGKVYNGSLTDIREAINASRPLVAYLNLGLRVFSIGHYVVVTGFDDERHGVIVHSGLDRDKFIAYKTFLRSWNRTDRWTLRVLPKDASATNVGS